MTVGFVMLCHEALGRSAQIAAHWAARGCPVVIHVDRRVSEARLARLKAALAEHQDILFAPRLRCDWGTFTLVDATQQASELLLDRFPRVGHVFLASGTCLPLRPTAELNAYLAERPGTDFIESVTTEDVPWTKGGLDHERFTLRFPFSWRRHRALFDGYVALQRRLGVSRRIPDGVVPHLGSQWWCLTRQTLSAILSSPRRAEYDRYFRRVWIPDESYFQSLVRLHSDRIESRSLTLAKFDFQGKPHIFYDDHLQLLRRSDCFVARKIWPQANRLYSNFLSESAIAANRAEPNPGKIDRIFAKATERRLRGRAGLHMAGRLPRPDRESARTGARYSVFQGFGDLFEDFPAWLHRTTGLRSHGHLFAPGRAEFADGRTIYSGALSDSAVLRDYNPEAFLRNLIWNTRGERQAFLFGPQDRQDIAGFFTFDSRADVMVIAGAWAIRLFRTRNVAPFAGIRAEAARLQRIESAHLDLLRSPHVKARVSIWNVADFVETPLEPLRTVLETLGPRSGAGPTEAPRMADLSDFGAFLQQLRNQGMNPHLVGDFRIGDEDGAAAPAQRRPYVVR